MTTGQYYYSDDDSGEVRETDDTDTDVTDDSENARHIAFRYVTLILAL